jgi:hypothetical protein
LSIFDEHDRIRAGRVWAYGCLTALVLFVILPISLWAFGVFSSGVRGQGDVIKQNNSGDNRIQAQSTFNKLWGDIQGYHDNIQAAAAAVKTNPADDYQHSVLTAEQQTCRSAVQEYNADTLNTTMRDWRPAQDPAQIDPAQECETAP